MPDAEEDAEKKPKYRKVDVQKVCAPSLVVVRSEDEVARRADWEYQMAFVSLSIVCEGEAVKVR
eukprot:9277839-Lingulodinium_polyedra.AAC.1